MHHAVTVYCMATQARKTSGAASEQWASLDWESEISLTPSEDTIYYGPTRRATAVEFAGRSLPSEFEVYVLRPSGISSTLLVGLVDGVPQLLRHTVDHSLFPADGSPAWEDIEPQPFVPLDPTHDSDHATPARLRSWIRTALQGLVVDPRPSPQSWDGQGADTGDDTFLDEVLRLYDGEGLTYQQIAERFQRTSASTAMRWVRRARSRQATRTNGRAS